jgi:hypothetical protein
MEVNTGADVDKVPSRTVESYPAANDGAALEDCEILFYAVTLKKMHATFILFHKTTD